MIRNSTDTPDKDEHRHPRDGRAASPIPLAAVTSWLREEVRWPEGMQLQAIRLDRVWPNKHGRMTFELAVDSLVGGRRTTNMIQGGGWEGRGHGPRSRDAVLDSGWIMNLHLSNSDLGLHLLSPDLDARLLTTQKGLGPDALAVLLRGSRTAAFLGMDENGCALSRQVVAYRVGKRCVLRLANRARGDGPRAFMKLFRRMPTEELLKTYRLLASHLQARSDGRIGLPAILDEMPSSRTVVLAEVEKPARNLNRSSDDLAIAASALVLLHAAPLRSSRVHTAQHEVDVARRWLSALRRLDPTLCDRMFGLVAQLVDCSKSVPPEPCCLVHRDYYDAQLIRQNERLWILDLDTLSLGHPEVDVSTFSAHLLLDELIGGSTEGEAASRVCVFVHAYLEHGGKLLPHRLRFYLPSAITRLAAIHATRGVNGDVLNRLWQLAEQDRAWETLAK